MSGVVSPNPECLLDTVIQNRANSARIHRQRSLGHESTLNSPPLTNNRWNFEFWFQ